MSNFYIVTYATADLETRAAIDKMIHGFETEGPENLNNVACFGQAAVDQARKIASDVISLGRTINGDVLKKGFNRVSNGGLRAEKIQKSAEDLIREMRIFQGACDEILNRYVNNYLPEARKARVDDGCEITKEDLKALEEGYKGFIDRRIALETVITATIINLKSAEAMVILAEVAKSQIKARQKANPSFRNRQP